MTVHVVGCDTTCSTNGGRNWFEEGKWGWRMGNGWRRSKGDREGAMGMGGTKEMENRR